MTAPLRVAAVGLGWVCQNRHLPVMGRSPDYEVVGVIDRADGRARDVARRNRHRLHAQASSLSQVPWLDEVDAITVSTAPMAHFDLVSEAIARGKHVLTEKPFVMNTGEGEQLLTAARDADRRLAIVHNFQFARSTRRMMADLASGTLGDIRGLDAVQFGNPARRLPAWCEQLPLGLFYDESPHLLYLLQSVAGALTLKRALVSRGEDKEGTPARVEAWFGADSADYPIRLACNFASPVSEWYLMVFGSRRLAIVDIFRDIYISLPNDGSHDTRHVLRTSVQAVWQHFAQHVTSGIPHLTGRLNYGNDELFSRFAKGVRGDSSALEPINADKAQAVLKLQHDIINLAEGV
jgi:scyllo-inositol 2-dehydrogenase (NADP+)